MSPRRNEGIGALRRAFPLNDGWVEEEPVEDAIDAGGQWVERAGLAARREGCGEATGSAAAIGRSPLDRAYFELLERVSILDAMRVRSRRWPLLDAGGTVAGEAKTEELFPESDAPDEWRYARSNGVAFHSTFEQARDHALWELAERDRVLRSWYGGAAPVRTDLPGEETLPSPDAHDWRGYVLPDARPTCWTATVRVAVVVGFPRRPSVPLAIGFGARPRAVAALSAAAREAVQRVAFLWDEAVPEQPAMGPPSPALHLDWYLCPSNHGRIHDWLAGEHARFGGASHLPEGVSAPLFADLTPHSLRGRAFVIKAMSSDVVPLTFGFGPEELSGHLPHELKIHPVS